MRAGKIYRLAGMLMAAMLISEGGAAAVGTDTVYAATAKAGKSTAAKKTAKAGKGTAAKKTAASGTKQSGKKTGQEGFLCFGLSGHSEGLPERDELF